MNADPLFGNTLEGEDSEWLYHYELALAKLLTAIVKDEDAAYVVAGATRRNKERPGTAALAALSDAYHYDPLDHIETLKAELHRPIQPDNTLRGYLNDLNRIRTELDDLGQSVPDKELIDCLVNGLRVPEYMPERNYPVHNPQTSFEAACSLCRKTAIHDTIVAGVAGSLPPAAFYASQLALPSSLAKHKQQHRTTVPAATDTPANLVDALTKLSESISSINTQLVAQAKFNKVV
jgi:hypothetical protein